MRRTSKGLLRNFKIRKRKIVCSSSELCEIFCECVKLSNQDVNRYASLEDSNSIKHASSGRLIMIIRIYCNILFDSIKRLLGVVKTF